jgi:hypothetical protein
MNQTISIASDNGSYVTGKRELNGYRRFTRKMLLKGGVDADFYF